MSNWFKKFVIISAIVVFVFVIILSIIETQNSYYQGKEIRLNFTDCDLQIATDNNALVTIEAYSDSYFQFKKDKTIISATPIEPPLTWAHNNCFYMKEEFTPGNWQESYGGDKILTSIKSQEDISLTVIPEKAKIIFGIAFISFFLWFLLISLISTLDD